AVDGGVIDEPRDRTELLLRRIEQLFHVGRFGGVGLQRDSLAAAGIDLFDNSFSLVATRNIARHDFPATLRCDLGGCSADAAAAAGDDQHTVSAQFRCNGHDYPLVNFGNVTSSVT